MTSSGIESETFRLVALCLKQLCYRVPHMYNVYTRKLFHDYEAPDFEEEKCLKTKGTGDYRPKEEQANKEAIKTIDSDKLGELCRT
jgi:hypothetical protein